MSSKKRKLHLIGAFAALATLALGVSCRGFFTNPTLTSVSVGPAGLSLTVAETFQMTATGTYDDNSQKTLTSGVTWSSSDGSTVSIGQSSGVVTGVQVGSATITGAAGSCSACSGSTSVTVVLNNVSSITVTPSSQTVSIAGTAVFFKAMAQPGSIDITPNATWTVLDSSGADQTSAFSISFVSGSGESLFPSSTTPAGTYTVVAGYSSTTLTGRATLIVTQ
jgi:hypothetical protein